MGALGSFPLTSPPSVKKEPKLEDNLLAKVMTYTDRRVWLTHPFPDTLELVASVTNDIQFMPDLSGSSAKKTYTDLDEILLGLITAPLPKGCGVERVKLIAPPKPYVMAMFGIDYAPHQRAHFTLRQTLGMDFPVWKARLEFSPSRAGPQGLKAIEEGIDVVAGALDFDRLLGAFRIARMDAAIDCIGAYPLDLAARVAKEGKRHTYSSPGIGPESVYIHKATPLPLAGGKPSKPLGQLLLTLYERRSQYVQKGWPPPYGDWPVTRAEVRRRWSNHRPSFHKLADLTNPFQGRHVAYAPALLIKKQLQWRDFCLEAFIGGPAYAEQSRFTPSWLNMAKLYRSFSADLIDEASWAGWHHGVVSTGMASWIDRAKNNQPV